MDRIVSGITDDGSVVCHAIESTDIVGRAAALHQTTPVATAALGRLLTAASLMGSQFKNSDESLTLHLKGDGPIGVVIAVSDFNGNVRGYVGNRIVELPLNSSGREDVGAAVGRNGALTVMRDLGKGAEPYVGSVALVSGEIAEDITAYYAQSEQIATACALGVYINDKLEVERAGGFIAQLLPGAAEEAIDQLEENIQTMTPVTTLLREGKSPEDILEIVLGGMNPNIVNTMPVGYVCNCSRDRVERALLSLGKEELQLMKEEDEVTEVDCHFCNKKYRFNQIEIQRLIHKATK